MILTQNDIRVAVKAMEMIGCKLISYTTTPNEKDLHLPTETLVFELTWYCDDEHIAKIQQKDADLKSKIMKEQEEAEKKMKEKESEDLLKDKMTKKTKNFKLQDDVDDFLKDKRIDEAEK